MHTQADEGEELYGIMTSFKKTGERESVDTLIKTTGVLTIKYVTQFIQFIANKTCASLKQTEREYSIDEKRELTFQYNKFIRSTFGDMIEDVTRELEKLEVSIPIAFFLDHFAIILGWIIGFFTKLMKIPTKDLTQRCIIWICATVEIEIAKPTSLN